MKIVLINGSHRQGNTQFMLRTILNEINEQDPSHVVTLINLRQKTIGPATEVDYSCYETQGCSDCCRDDMSEIYSLIQPCDIIIFGSPIYFSNVSGKMKDFMDRCHAYYFNKKLTDKHMIVVGVGATQANEEFFASWKAFGTTLGMKLQNTFYAQGDIADYLQNDSKTTQMLKEFTKCSLQLCAKQN